ncbi:efflux RND transporter permease subunit [Sneathiella sp.]|jgi:multidrug efflux pump subunit AcrB|uniref:efflux RND transporter permease subunit n=1 Tax=Sneathiella sp. TaxID=1964365 RepID=UPI0039E52721
MAYITEFALNNSRITILSVLAIVIMGVLTFVTYPSREDPSIVIRNANITTQFPGMSSRRVEDLLTRPLEEKIRQIPEVKHIDSDSKTGVSLIKIILHDSVDDLAPVWADLRDKMTDITSELPEGTIGPQVNDQVGETAVATIALWSDGFSLSEMKETAKNLSEKFYTLDGISKVERFGEQDERVYLYFKRSRITQLGINLNTVVATLRDQNIILPGGKIDAAGQNIILEPSGNFDTVEEIENTFIEIPETDQVFRLKDLVEIQRDYIDPPKDPVYFNGKPAIIISLSIKEGINSVAFGEKLVEKVDALQQQLPWGYVLDFATFQPELVEDAVEGAVNNLYQTLVIVLVIVMLFLGVRTGLIVGSFVPITMLMSIIIMRQFDVELQRVSIAAMIIALGMLVDNGIVIAEDIGVRLKKGEDRRAAAIEASKTLAMPLLTSSLTTILFFIPMALSEGGAGEFTGSLAQVVTIVLLSSWFLSLFLTPVLCVWFMKISKSTVPKDGQGQTNSFKSRFERLYRSILEAVLKFRYLFLLGMVGLLLLSGYLLNFVGKEFFPLGDRNQYLIYLDLPAGTSVKKTDVVVGRLTGWLSDQEINPQIESNIAYVGNGGPRFFLSLAAMDPDPHRAFILVTTKSTEDVDGLVAKTRRYMLDALPEARGEAKKMWMGASEAGLFQLRFVGDDSLVLRSQADKLVETLKQIPGMLVAKQNWENPVIKIIVDVDQARARQAGVTSEDVANALNIYFSGSAITEFREGDTVIPIVIQSDEQERGTINGLIDVVVFSSSRGEWVPLDQIATINGQWETARIKRRDQERAIMVTAKHQTLSAAEIFSGLDGYLAGLDIPDGHRWEIAGEVESQAEANEKLFANLPVCLGIIVLLLVWQFNSFRRPVIIFLTIPLILVGATAGLFALNALFGFMVILGFFSLAGIIINNGIVLIDRIDFERDRGQTAYDALVTACLARLQPIMITSLTTVLGLLPLIISQDPLFYAMASAMAFGLGVGTVLTLAVVPTLYAVFFNIRPETG